MPAILRTGDWLGSGCAIVSDIFRKRSQLPQTKPTSANEANGKTIVKTMFEHEQHNAWPNEPDQSAMEESIWPNEPKKAQYRRPHRRQHNRLAVRCTAGTGQRHSLAGFCFQFSE
jgi:hypothetical protein